MGHLHGDSIADLQFPAKLGKKLLREGYVSPHHIIPKSGWVSHEIQNAKDVEEVIESSFASSISGLYSQNNFLTSPRGLA
jgi:Family of unknown function (DUF5519)